MTDRMPRLTVDTDVTSLTQAIPAAARTAPLLMLSGAALGELAEELGGDEAAGRFLFDVASDIGKPLAIHVEADDGTSSTAFISPKGWTHERLQGWIGGHHAELE